MIRAQVWIFGKRERGDKHCVFYVVKDRTAETLLPIIKKHVKPGSIIMSDMWKAYNGITAMGFDHHSVNHSLHFVASESQNGLVVHTNSIESIWKDAKRFRIFQ